MAKCKACGEIYPEGSRFCARCGSSVADDNTVIAEALKEAQKDFDRDSMATLDKSRITYVCSICGSINRIDQPKCTRCGKPRPRNEYVNALKRINQSAEFNAQQETLVAPLPVAAPEQPVEEAPVAEPVKEVAAPVQAAQPVVANMMVAGGQQGVVAQPFVVVPYVDSMYPLRQYNPNQLYRYQPYTPEELAAIKQQKEAEELRARLAAQQAQAAQEEISVKDNCCKASKRK
ncbi:MAG: zinc ribbon domain-containing protein [Clostridia bacterium]|nr:zinc ribbon domain-containing protein [Clostridia bacterium]